MKCATFRMTVHTITMLLDIYILYMDTMFTPSHLVLVKTYLQTMQPNVQDTASGTNCTNMFRPISQCLLSCYILMGLCCLPLV